MGARGLDRSASRPSLEGHGALEVALVSTSPRRLAILRMLGIEPLLLEPGAAERPYQGSADPTAYAVEQALAKLRSAAVLGPWRVGLAADTIVVLNGRVLGKPATPRRAREMLGALSGKSHEVITGIALSWRGLERTACERTRVTFRSLAEREIARYVESGEPLDKAAAYGVQERGAAFVRRVEGCFFNVMGLPVTRWLELLSDLGLFYDPGSGALEEGREGARGIQREVPSDAAGGGTPVDRPR
jgi:septum formation protein